MAETSSRCVEGTERTKSEKAKQVSFSIEIIINIPFDGTRVSLQAISNSQETKIMTKVPVALPQALLSNQSGNDPVPFP